MMRPTSRRTLFLAGLSLLCLGSHGAEAQSQQQESVKAYTVLKAGRVVLTIQNRPGQLLSTALPPAGSPAVQHRFLSATAHAPEEEDALRSILEKSSSFDDFVNRLRDAGYTLREIHGP